MDFNPNKSPNPRTHLHKRGVNPSNFSTNSGMDSHYFLSPHEHDENKGHHARGYDSSPVDFVNLENRRVLTERNTNYFSGPKERKSSNSEIDFGSALFGDTSKPPRNQSELEADSYGCEINSVLRSKSNSNSVRVRTCQSPERGYTSDFAQEERFDSDFEFRAGRGKIREDGFSRPHQRGSSVGNLADLESKFEFGSGLHRSVSPKGRSRPNSEMGFYSSSFQDEPKRKTNEVRCHCELGSSNREFKMDQTPNFGSYCSPIGSSKFSHDPKTNYLSPRPRCLCSRPQKKSNFDSHQPQFTNSPFSSHYLQEKSNFDSHQPKFSISPFSSPYLKEKSNFDSLSNKPKKKVSVSSEITKQHGNGTKGHFSFSKLFKIAILFGFLFMACFFVKEVPSLRSNLVFNWHLRANNADLALNPVYLGDFQSYDEKFENIELIRDQENKIAEINPNLEEIKEEEGSFGYETEKEIESLALNDPILVEEEIPYIIENEKLEEDEEKETQREENTILEEMQSELGGEINSENTEQKEISKLIIDEQEEPISRTNLKIDLVESCVVSAPIQKSIQIPVTKEKEESSKDALRIGFSVAFICVALCASLVSCFIKRDQFSEMLTKWNHYSSKNSEKRPKKRSRDGDVLSNEESYGSFLTYKKIPAKKKYGEEDGLLTPVRRSSRIRNHITSPS